MMLGRRDPAPPAPPPDGAIHDEGPAQLGLRDPAPQASPPDGAIHDEGPAQLGRRDPAPPVPSPDGAIDDEGPAQDVGRASDGFYDPYVFNVGGPGTDLWVSDVDDNGVPDLLVPILGGGLALVINQSTVRGFQFALQSVETGQGHVLDALIVDYDQEPLPDLFLTLHTGELQIRSQVVAGEFSAPLLVLENVFGLALTVDQVNSDDTVLDVLIASDRKKGLAAIWFESEYTPLNIFPARLYGPRPSPERTSYSHMVTGDLDHNGLNDVILMEGVQARVEVYLHYPQPNKPKWTWDEDGNMIPAHQDRVYPSHTTHYEPSGHTAPSGAIPLRGGIGDFNNDGLEDVIVLYRGPSGATKDYAFFFQPPMPPTAEDWPSHVLACYETIIEDTWLESGERALLDFRMGLYFPGWVHDFKIEDLDQDGNLDIVGVSEKPGVNGNSYLFYYLGLGDFQFADPIALIIPGNPLRVAAVDLDGDGYPDIAVLNPFQSSLYIYANDGGSGQGNPGITFEMQEVIFLQ